VVDVGYVSFDEVRILCYALIVLVSQYSLYSIDVGNIDA